MLTIVCMCALHFVSIIIFEFPFANHMHVYIQKYISSSLTHNKHAMNEMFLESSYNAEMHV